MKRCLAAILLVSAISLLARAEDPPPQAGRLGDGELFAMLQGLGLSPEKVNESLFRALVKHDDWTLPVHFALSRSGEKVWIYAHLGELPDPAKAPADRLARLLAAHERIAPVHFYLADAGKRLQLGTAADNRAVTPAVLRDELQRLCAAVSATHDLWDVAGWPAEKD